MLIVLNVGENQIPQINELEKKYRSMYSSENFDVIAICGKLEYELSQLGSEVNEFRASLGLAGSSIERIIKSSFKLLGLISFYTTVSDELKAWTLNSGTPAVKAAGKIHTDIERGFIKAEVISYNDLQQYPDLANIKKHGLLKIEGKDYIVNDGDIITFLFNK
jgi:ribosome-binding ATPase YchF (GTP1/OBG family)